MLNILWCIDLLLPIFVVYMAFHTEYPGIIIVVLGVPWLVVTTILTIATIDKKYRKEAAEDKKPFWSLSKPHFSLAEYLIFSIIIFCALWIAYQFMSSGQTEYMAPINFPRKDALSQKTPTAPSSTQPSLNVKFTGTIQAVKNRQPYDGPLSIEVDGKWIVIGGGEMEPSASNGSVIGLDLNVVENNIGKKVEVFAAKANPQSQEALTILGSSQYYVKLVR